VGLESCSWQTGIGLSSLGRVSSAEGGSSAGGVSRMISSVLDCVLVVFLVWGAVQGTTNLCGGVLCIVGGSWLLNVRVPDRRFGGARAQVVIHTFLVVRTSRVVGRWWVKGFQGLTEQVFAFPHSRTRFCSSSPWLSRASFLKFRHSVLNALPCPNLKSWQRDCRNGRHTNFC
jgi:hypothetical protein